MKRKEIFITILLVFASIATAIGASIIQRRISSSGVVHVVTLGIDAFWDENCTNVVTEINWGILEPGDTASKVFYVENTGNAAVVLSMVTESWVPTGVESLISIIWNAENSTLSAGAVKAINLTISISFNITSTTNFALDIVLTGGEI